VAEHGQGEEILVVDDSEELGQLMADLLAVEGYHALYFSSGNAALAAVRERRPALVLTDAMMPGMTGLELITILRSDLAPPVPPVIVVSGFPALEEEARKRGAFDFLHKPTHGADLLAAVRRALDHHPRDPVSSELARLRAMRDRRQVSEAAGAALAAIEHAGERIEDPARRLAAWLGEYFGFGTVMVVSCDLRVLAEVTARGAHPIPDHAAARPFLQDVAETGSSLLIPDTEAYAALAALARKGGIRFFAGVPVLVGGTAVAALALLDTRPQLFNGSDLGLLEHVGRLVGTRLGHAGTETAAVGEPLLDEAWRLSRTSFETFLSAELRLAGQTGGAFALGVAEFGAPLPLQPPSRADGEGVRLAVGRLGPQRIAVFKRDESVERATAVLDAVIGPGHDGPPLQRAAVLSLSSPAVALVNERVALDLAENGVVTSPGGGATTRLRLTVQHARPALAQASG
jgi:CheY-like chemotaxis protein